MKNKFLTRLDFVFRAAFLLIYATTLLLPARTIAAAPASPAAAPVLELPDNFIVASQEDFKAKDNFALASAGPITADGADSQTGINLFSGLFSPFRAYPAPASTYVTNGGLEIEPIAAYNLIVDSNVLSPSSYGPNAATLGAKFCNRSGSAMTNVWAYIGDYTGSGAYKGTPGEYPVHNPTTDPTFAASFPHLASFPPTEVDYGDPTRFYALEHEAGSVADATDATRYIGTLADGECRTQYWLVSYPRKAKIGGNWVDVTGGTKPTDDLWLQYDFWATSGADSSNYSYYTRSITMRNEISAMANKIWPNTDSKVPDQYLQAIQAVLGWDTWVEGGGTTAFPGQTAVSQGIWYDFGNVGAGFDNNYDLVPDRNAWVQPIGDASSYDPGCFRLVRTYGIIIVKLNDGSELLIPFVDQMYFENLPANNTGAVGLVYYEYMALDGACSAGLTPYQEVASGYDNEKFNADFGAGIPPLQSQESIMSFDKTDAPTAVNPGAQLTYTLAYTNVDPDGPGGMSISVGAPSVGSPFVVQDKIPDGTCYVTGSAAGISPTYPNNLLVDGAQTPSAYTVMYSTDADPSDGIVWQSVEPTDPTPATACNEANITYLRWLRNDAVANGSTGQVQFKVFIPATYVNDTGKVTVENTGCLKLGEGSCFKEDTETTAVAGNGSINGYAWKDDGVGAGAVLANALKEANEAFLPAIGVKLYWDANGDGDYADAGDFLYAETQTLNYNVIDGYIDVNGDNAITADDDVALAGVSVIDGALDMNNDGAINASDGDNASNIYFFAGFRVYNGRIDVNNSGASDAGDDGSLAGRYSFNSLPATNTSNPKYILVLESNDTDIPSGYGPTAPITYKNIEVGTTTAEKNYGDAASEPTNFGFAPALSVTKRLATTNPVVGGQPVQFALSVTNNLLGSGDNSSVCRYYIWASVANQTGGVPPGGSLPNGVFSNPNNVLGRPDDKYSFSNIENNADYIGLSGFNIGNLGGTITKVEFLVDAHERKDFKPTDNIYVYPWNNTTNTSMGTYTYNGGAYFTGPVNTQYYLSQDITALRSWTWADFQNNLFGIRIEGNKGSGPGTSGDIDLDAVAYIITTNGGTCGGDAQTLNPVPLTDVFDNTRLTFVSANPPVSSQSDSGSETTLTWNNVGPLYPGQTREILVDFIAKDVTSQQTTTNKDESVGAKFSTGQSANSDLRTESDNQASVTINPTGSIAGVVWADANNSGWDTGAVGYTNGENGIAGVTVSLYACMGGNSAPYTYITSSSPNYETTDTCAQQDVVNNNSGVWRPVSTTSTNINGAYNFTGLVPGFYYVVVDSASLPTGLNVQTAEPIPNATGAACGTCNHYWEPSGASGTRNSALLNPTNFNELTTGENITNINFGYRGNAVISGNVWQDYNGDSTRQSADTALGSVTVTLNNCGADNVCGNGDDVPTTTTTDSNGYYEFAGLTAGRTYQVSVNTGTLPAGATWTQTDEDKNNANDSPYNNNLVEFVNVQANTSYVNNNFGFHRGSSYSVGDTLFYDWDGDATQDAIDEGIKDVTVYLYEDLDADGVIDASDPLVATDVTDANGAYLFENLANGNYLVKANTADVDFPQNLNQTRDPGEFVIIDGYLDLNGYGISSTDDTLLLYGKKIIDGAVDMNADNVINAGDTGTYLGFNVYNGRLDTSGNGGAGAEDDLYHVAACNTCDSQNNIILSGASNLDQDFGYQPLGVGTIGDYVWKDMDGDGIKDSGEAGIAGMVVRLEADMNGDGTYVTLAQQTTDSSGYYLFSDLPVGTQYNYRVVLEMTPGAGQNYEKIPSDSYGYKYYNTTGTLDTTPDPDFIYTNATITTAAPNYLNADFGFAPRASIGDTVYQDVNGNGTQDNSEPGINGVTVNLYSFADGNNNNRYDPGETLGALVASATTAYDSASGKDGMYKFSGLQPNPAGQGYVAIVDNADPDLAGATLTGDPSVDGFACAQLNDPADPGEPSSVLCDHRDGMRLYAGTNYTGADFGYQLPGSFGDLLWIDTDGDGQLDVGESPIPNVTVTATTTVPADTTVTVNGVTYNPGQTVTLTAVSDVNGAYNFQGIKIGGSNPANVSWTVSVDTGDADFPAGLSNTYDPDGGNNNATAVVMNPAGTITQVGNLLNGNDDGDSSDPLYLDADFGYRFVGNTNISGTICLENTTKDGVCGTSVTDPSGIGGGEIAYSSVTVYLYRLVDNPGGTTGQYDPGIDDVVLAGVTNTAGNGDYSFSNVANGVYYIIAVGAPQSGIELTSNGTTVNSGGDGAYTVQYNETKTADGVTTLSAFQVVDATAPGGVAITDRDFAFEAPVQYDYGDLPAIFEMTSVADDGARHVITPSLYLGPVSGGAPDADADGYPSVSSSSDDNVGTTDDENGVTFPTNWTNSTTSGNNAFNYATDGGGSVTVEVQGGGYLLAWIDINGDGLFSSYDHNGDGDYNDYLDVNNDGDAKDGGEWYEYNEFIFSQAVSTGTQTATFQIPFGTLSAAATTFNMRFRLFPEMPLVPSLAYKGAASGGEVEDYQINVVLSTPPSETPHTTPVTLASFRAQRAGSKVNFNWSTATETGNAGFNLYVESLGQLVKINGGMIPSAVIDSLETQEYSFSADMGGSVFYLEEVDVFGETRRYGPFRANESYGSALDVEKIDQLAVQQEYAASAAQRENRMKPAMRVGAAALRSPVLSRTAVPQISNTLNLKVTKTGLYRVTYEQLRDAGLDLLRVPAAKITLSNRGRFIPAVVVAPNSARARGLFGPGGYIEFYGQALDTLYTDANVYTVQVVNTAATRVPVQRSVVPARAPVETSFTETLVVNNQNRYAYFAPGADVWYDKAMSVAKGKPNSWDWTFNVVNLAAGAQSLEVTLWGVNDTPSLTPDHSVVILLNGTELAREKFNGLTEKVIKVNLPAGLLQEGENTLRITMPADTRAPSDLVALDKFSVKYQRNYQATDDQLTFTSSGKAFVVTNLTTNNVVVYRVDGRNVTQLSGVKISAAPGGGYTVSFAGTGKPATYIVSAARKLPAPEMQATRLAVNLNQPAQYLIIAHPHFIDGLQPFVAAKQAQGFTVSVVDVYDLYQQYNYGVFDPSAIKAYIAYAAKNLGTKDVLLVGGDTYDYRDYLKKGSVSFIPSLYVATGSQYAKFVPVDPLYADVDNDNVPDLAIGRFPVRTRAELDLMIQKTLAYAAKDYGGTAVFASDKFDGSASFKQISNGMAATLPGGWSNTMIHLDDTDVAAAQTQLLASMNNGVALVTYAGHSGAQSWTFSGLFNSTHAKNLTNAGKPFVVVQWGCWNTYYVDPVNEYMAQSFLFAGDKGAAAVLGAVTLTDSTSERKLGELLTPRMTTPGKTIGQALLEAKKELAKTDPKLIDVLLGWTLMGDPAMVVQP